MHRFLNLTKVLTYRGNKIVEKLISTFKKMWHWEPVEFPEFSGERIMMMPVILGRLSGVPEQYKDVVSLLYQMVELRHLGEIGYLTIDERSLKKGETLRREGKHVDGYYHGQCGAWGGGSGEGGSWGSVGNGMLVVSSTPHCKAYLGIIDGKPLDEGECDHLTMPNEGLVFDAGAVYWVDGACVHESLPVEADTKRQFLRLSLPNNGPWFEGYTENPSGIAPAGKILPKRKFMKEKL